MTIESNQAQNLAKIRSLAIETFGSEPAAESWLNHYHALLGASPNVVAESPSGFVEVQKILGAISYGGAV
jgi:uncharacterized protein (DUF2384 family)